MGGGQFSMELPFELRVLEICLDEVRVQYSMLAVYK